MSRTTTSRRAFLKASAVGAFAPFAIARGAATKSDRLTVAAIGVGGRGSGIGRQLARHGDMAAVCDVDSRRAARFKGKSTMQVYTDYRKLLDRKDLDAVTVGTPDHWHTPIVLAALRAGKDVYCEKPLTLTVDEGKILCRAVKETGRILQVGTQQRTAYRLNFLRAVVLAQSGRLGKIKRVTVSIGGGPNSPSFKTAPVPPGLDWDFWLGQAPEVPYTPQRCHGSFRWWYEYSGGKMTDWGAHHVDIAQWAVGRQHSGPVSVEALSATLPDNADKNGYNTAMQFKVRCVFGGGGEMIIQHSGNGIQIDGTKGQLSVSRRAYKGNVADAIRKSKADSQRLDAEVRKLFAGRQPKGHMENFLDAVRDRKQPISDVFTHHRVLTTCHLASIAIRTRRKITWDPKTEQAVGDDDINANWLKRPHRKGYEFSG